MNEGGSSEAAPAPKKSEDLLERLFKVLKQELKVGFQLHPAVITNAVTVDAPCYLVLR